ncbi:MAG: hypothetical protein P8X47_03215 [Ignavibacteriaceae bacterium]
MSQIYELDKIAITVKSHRLLKILLKENPKLEETMHGSKNETEALVGVKNWILELIKDKPNAIKYYEKGISSGISFKSLDWSDIAAIRILDYVDNAGREFIDLNLRGQLAVSNPIKLLWLGVNKGTGGAKPDFFEDMIHLFRQLMGKEIKKEYSREKLKEWMNRFPSGLDPRIVKLREENRERILNIIIDKIDEGEINDSKYKFDPELSRNKKLEIALEWWKESTFHLRFAVRSPDLLNEFLGYSLDPDTMKILYEAEKKGIPFFVNPYYLSLLHVRVPYFAVGADLAIRHYVVYSKQLIDEFGYLTAWEKEDKVEPGKPNAAGWILPSHHNVHRRYPEVAILIPDTMGRACAGLCSSCQRMYDFQNGYLNFNLNKLRPDETWSERLERLMEYFENDSQLRDILITGGDALMSSDKSLENILDDEAVKKLINAGWIVTNQHVFTTASSRRGHNLKLREVMNDIGVLPYYTFSVKGYMENYFNFAPNSRAVQESIEEKVIGNLSESSIELTKKFTEDAENIIENINSIRKAENIPFIATDRNVLNLPGVGKSLTFRVIGITRYGRRILEFEHDSTRSHSPIIEQMKKVIIIESKSISEYLNQLEEIGDNKEEYIDVYGYSIGETEARMPLYEYPEVDISITKEFTNLEIPDTDFATVEV